MVSRLRIKTPRAPVHWDCSKHPQADDGVERMVRINCLREQFGLLDVQAILATDTPPPALMLPKVRTPDEVAWLDTLLTERGHDIRLHVIIETQYRATSRLRDRPFQPTY